MISTEYTVDIFKRAPCLQVVVADLPLQTTFKGKFVIRRGKNLDYAIIIMILCCNYKYLRSMLIITRPVLCVVCFFTSEPPKRYVDIEDNTRFTAVIYSANTWLQCYNWLR